MYNNVKSEQSFVYYNGQVATIVAHTPNSQFITIEVNGVKISVNKNDLFGMNNLEEVNKYYDEQIAYYDEQMKKNEETIDANKSLWTACKNAIREGKQLLASILNELGVQDFSQITDKEQKQRYQDTVAKNSTARSTQLRATSDIISAANDTCSCATSKINLVNQQYIANTFA